MKFLWLEIRLKLYNLDIRPFSKENECALNFNFISQQFFLHERSRRKLKAIAKKKDLISMNRGALDFEIQKGSYLLVIINSRNVDFKGLLPVDNT